MQVCLLCRKGDRVFLINYGTGKYTIKDDLLMFFGHKVEPYLHEEDVLCGRCMNFIDRMANIKRLLLPRIYKPARKLLPEIKPIKFERIWNFISDYGVNDDSDSDSGASWQNLLKAKFSIPYKEVKNDIHLQRTYSYARSDTPIADAEIRKVMKRRKRKCHNWTRKKHSRCSRLCISESYTRSYSRSESCASFHSFVSYERPQSCHYMRESRSLSRLEDYEHKYNGSNLRSICTVKYDKMGRLLNKRTRSVSRIQDEEQSLWALNENLIFRCSEEACNDKIFESLESLTEHKVVQHKKLAMFWCNECRFRCISQEDLDRHNSLQHYILLSNCMYCSLELKNQEELQEHLEEHLQHSVPCIYCDKFFLTKQLCTVHVNEYHKDKRKRIRNIKPNTILDQIVKDDISDDEEEIIVNAPRKKRKEYTVTLLTQHCPVNENGDGTEADVSPLQRVDVIKNRRIAHRRTLARPGAIERSSRGPGPVVDLDATSRSF